MTSLRCLRHPVLRPALVLALASTALGLAGCVTVPAGPAVTVLPGQYKPWDQFRIDDVECRNYASAAIGGPTQEAQNAAAAQAAGAAAIGAAAGAIIGSVTGQAGQGAAIGAGTGLLFGSAAGNNVAWGSSYGLQQRYDGAYLQCMYAKGNQVPVRGAGRAVGPQYAQPAPQSPYPPPPPQRQ
jgi:hypothetical protein